MNNKNKVLLTSVGLALLSGIAATSSTFAWFTTSRTASVSYSSATVSTNQSNLTIAYDSSLNTLGAPTGGGTNPLVLTGANAITDISGNGLAFFKPVWSATAGTASEIESIPVAAAGDADGYYVDFTVELEATGNTSLNVYLGTGTQITSVNAKALAASRMAVIVGGAVKFIYAPDADYTDATDTVQTGHRYLSAASATPKIVTGTSQDATKTSFGGTVFPSFTTYTTNSAASTAGAIVVANLTPVTGTPDSELITFRIWLEGEDVEADNDAISGVLSAAINFYALEV